MTTDLTTGITADITWRQGTQGGAANFALSKGVTALIGPSGAGKSTLARLLAGLEHPVRGTIVRKSVPLFDSTQGVTVKPEARQVGYVPQDPALFPHMSVRDNIRFGARISGTQLDSLISTAGLETLMDRQPHTLSGGEARRVALVRALATKPVLLILDEPMNGLDPNRRRLMMTLIRETAKHTGIPILMITHQIEEMLHTADHALLMNEGRILMQGSIEEVMAHSETAKILQYDDAGAVIEVTVENRQDGVVETRFGDTPLFLPDEGEAIGAKLRLRILARDVAIALTEPTGISIVNRLPCRIDRCTKLPSGQELLLTPMDSKAHLLARITEKSFRELGVQPGQQVYALVKAVAVREMLNETQGP